MSTLLPLFGCFFLYSRSEATRYRINLLCYLPILIFSTLRGYAGTDTANYRDLYQRAANNSAEFSIDSLVGMDPLFTAFRELFIFFGTGFQVFAFGQALFCWIVFSKGASKIDKNFPILSVGLLPVLMLDACFNGLRYGMAFALASYLIPLTFRYKSYFSHFLRVIPGLLHSSMFLVAFMTPLSAIFLLIALSGLYLHPNFEYILNFLSYKTNEYADTARPSQFSGAFPFFEFMVLLFLTKYCKIKFERYRALLISAMSIMTSAIFLSFYTVASLRFMHISVFLLAIAIGLSDIGRNRNKARWIILILGAMNVLNFYRQIIFGFSEGNVFYLPYDFYWEI